MRRPQIPLNGHQYRPRDRLASIKPARRRSRSHVVERHTFLTVDALLEHGITGAYGHMVCDGMAINTSLPTTFPRGTTGEKEGHTTHWLRGSGFGTELEGGQAESLSGIARTVQQWRMFENSSLQTLQRLFNHIIHKEFTLGGLEDWRAG